MYKLSGSVAVYIPSSRVECCKQWEKTRGGKGGFGWIFVFFDMVMVSFVLKKLKAVEYNRNDAIKIIELSVRCKIRGDSWIRSNDACTCCHVIA